MIEFLGKMLNPQLKNENQKSQRGKVSESLHELQQAITKSSQVAALSVSSLDTVFKNTNQTKEIIENISQLFEKFGKQFHLITEASEIAERYSKEMNSSMAEGASISLQTKSNSLVLRNQMHETSEKVQDLFDQVRLAPKLQKKLLLLHFKLRF